MTIETAEQQANTEKVVEKVRKLLNLANKNPNQEEAASATAKAMELLAAYNLDMTLLEQGGSESGKREDARQKGGMYIYERELWDAIAKLNFCFYFTTREWKQKGNRKWVQFQHRIVGRVVNTTGTKVMGQYIQSTIERICRERFPVNSQFFMSEAVAYREGMASAVMHKLKKRRRQIDAEEERRADLAEEERLRAAKKGVSTATALTLSDVRKSEEAANYDFLNGDGAWARREANRLKYREEWEQQRAAEAAAEAAADAEYTRWAKANPEEAAKEAAKERARQRKADEKADRKERRRTYRERAPTARERRESSGYYHNGYDKGKNISIDPQMDSGSAKRIGR